MATYTELAIGIEAYQADDDANTIVVHGVKTQTPSDAVNRDPRVFSYSYGVYDIMAFLGDDVVVLENLTAIDPAGVNPRGRQVVNVSDGNDFVSISSLTAASVFGGEGADTIIKVDQRATSSWAVESGLAVAYPPDSPDGLSQDANWLDFDIIDGGPGNDTITSGSGPDWIYGSTGNDYVSVGSGNNVVFSAADDDTIIVAGMTFRKMNGGLPPQGTHFYAWSTNAIWAGTGNDTVSVYDVSAGDQLVAAINGEEGNDSITVRATSASWVTGGDGNDTISISQNITAFSSVRTIWSAPADTVWAGAGDDVIYTERGDDNIVAGAGHDWIFAGFGNDHLYGGPDADGETDRFSFSDYHHDDFVEGFQLLQRNDVDIIYDFQSAQHFAGAAGKGDVIDVAAMMQDNSVLSYQAANPFTAGELQLVASPDLFSTYLLASDGAGGWNTVLILYGVGLATLDTTQQADVTAGLAAKTGGDFLWFTG